LGLEVQITREISSPPNAGSQNELRPAQQPYSNRHAIKVSYIFFIVLARKAAAVQAVEQGSVNILDRETGGVGRDAEEKAVTPHLKRAGAHNAAAHPWKNT
jgi:hypothetical protein